VTLRRQWDTWRSRELQKIGVCGVQRDEGSQRPAVVLQQQKLEEKDFINKILVLFLQKNIFLADKVGNCPIT